MTQSLAVLRQRRAELDQRIAEAEAGHRDLWNDALNTLSDKIYALGFARDMPVADAVRKNVTTLTVGAVRIELGYIEEPWGAWLAVHREDLHIVFGAEGEAPGPAVMTALIGALLDEEG